MKLSERGPIMQVRLLFDGEGGVETVNINDEVAQLEERVRELEADLASVTESDHEAWYWVDKTCEWLECGVEGVFAIKSRIEQLKALGG